VYLIYLLRKGVEMVMYFIILVAIFFGIHADNAECKGDAEFVILIPSYNNEKWVEENLASVCWQKTSKPYQVIYINDCSADKTGELVDSYVKEHDLGSRVTVVHNNNRVGALGNIYNAVHNMIPDHKIVVEVDGDDLLADNEVLLRLENHYKDSNIWFTYSRMVNRPSGIIPEWRCAEIPDSAFQENAIRKNKLPIHLYTFKAALFKKILRDDLLYEGKFFPMAWDVAILAPMLEMAGQLHTKYINEIQYIYRVNNPLNDFRVSRALQKDLAAYILAKQRYLPLDSL
jgi:glycosyltransferase involved in cell wall biosynthesis